ncbi:MAG: CobW family GTP-binding protein [Sporichthyaceae bacterium]
MTDRVPVVVLTGHLGSGKTTLLNFLLRRPGARMGVVVNDFGAINVDAALVAGQVDEPASIAGGCICCLPDAGGLDEALAKLAAPRLGLDVVVVEASGLAEPATLARLERIAERVRSRNPAVQIVHADHARVDPALIYDAAATEDPPDQLPFGEALRAELREHREEHVHADSVAVEVAGPVEPAGLVELLADPPATAYRIKGIVHVAGGAQPRRYAVNVVGGHGDVAPLPTGAGGAGAGSHLVAIGLHLDTVGVRRRLERALRATDSPSTQGLRALRRVATASRPPR